MKSYLNLDLLYCCFEYLYPLFYYKDNYDQLEVYSPMTFRSIFSDDCDSEYYDYVAFTYKNGDGRSFPLASCCSFTQEYSFCNEDIRFKRCVPFELKKEHISFLKIKYKLNININ